MVACRIVLLVLLSNAFYAEAQKYDLFEIENNELIWRNTYPYDGPLDSLRSEIVSMLKSKVFTRNVTRNEIGTGGIGYTGEIQHYHVDCKSYGRKYNNTPLIYWSGEWKGKFVIEVRENRYQVTIYGLYFENPVSKNTPPHQSKTARKGYYVKEVWQKGHPSFKPNVLEDMVLMSVSLRDAFDITKYTSPVRPWD